MSSENEQSAEPGAGAPEQLALIRETVRRAKVPRAKPRTWRGAPLADELPVARVLVNKGVLHLDQYFDYAVPEELDADARPGVRVRVRFGAGGRNVQGGRREGGGLIDGFIVERRADSDYQGALAAIASVVSPSRSSDPSCSPSAAPSPTGTRAASPTSSSSPCRRATPAPSPSPPRTRCLCHRPPSRAAGSGTARARPSCAHWPRAVRRAPCGPPCPARTGPPRSPGPSRRRSPPGAAPSSSSRTGGRPDGSTRP